MKKIASLFPIILALAGCTSQPLEEPAQPSQTAIAENEVYVTSPCTDFEVNEATVLKLAKNFNESASVSRGTTKTVKTIESVNDEGGNPLLYVINYENNGGFLVVSAKAESQPVLAFSDEGSFDLGTVDNSGVSLWLSDQKLMMKHVNSLPDSIIAQNRLMWKKYLGEKRPLEAPAMSRGDLQEIWPMIQAQINAWEADGYTVYTFNEFRNAGGFSHLPQSEQDWIETIPYSHANIYYGDPTKITFVIQRSNGGEDYPNLCETKWGQSSNNFNVSHPKYNPSAPDKWPMGCSTIAAGQIMRFHEFPTKYNWAGMGYNTGNKVTSDFLLDLANKIGVKFKEDAGSADIDDTKNAFLAWGYSCSKFDYNINRVIVEIRADRPVLMQGKKNVLGTKGHQWVADGFRTMGANILCEIQALENSPEGFVPRTFYKVHSFVGARTNNTPMIHMNWGWHGLCDGYFYNDDVTVNINGETVAYKHHRHILTNISPN